LALDKTTNFQALKRAEISGFDQSTGSLGWQSDFRLIKLRVKTLEK